MFVVGHFFFLGVGLGLDMRWAGVLRSFGPTVTIIIREKLTNAFKALFNNPFKESFYRESSFKFFYAIFIIVTIIIREMLMNALRALFNNPFKESFYGQRKKIN